MEILSTRSFVTGEQPRAASRSILTDGEGRPVAALSQPTDRQRVAASIVVALRQGRISLAEVKHFADLGVSDPDACLDTLVSRPRPKLDADEAFFAEYAALTGVPPVERPQRSAADAAYLAYAAACGIRHPATGAV